MSQPQKKSTRRAWDRDQHLRALPERVHDLVVVGGGATGCSVARDAALRGLDVCLVERSDLASGTSSRSTRLIHGGLRYLRTWEFGFVREGLQERAILLEVAPHLVRPVPFLFPAYRDRGSSRWLLRLGVGLYDALSGGRRLSPTHLLSAATTLRLEPGLKSDGLTGSVSYTDAMTDDARLVVETGVAAVESGATVALHVEVERIVPSDSGPAVLMLRDRLSDTTLGARAGVVINATGTWSVGIQGGRGTDGAIPSAATRLRPSRGSHLVVSREDLPVSQVVVMPSRRDGRLVFAVPAGGFTYVGTTEVDHTGPPNRVRAEAAEVDYLREVTGEVFHSGPVPRERILSTWAGLRPLIDRPGQPTPTLSRDFRIMQEAPGIISVVGGKLTSCRRMAEAAVDLAASILARRFGKRATPCITRWKLFPGAEGSLAAVTAEPIAGLDPAVSTHLASTYGSRAAKIFRGIATDPASGVPFAPACAATAAEVAHAVEHEGAVRLADLLFRRMHPLFIEARMTGREGRMILEAASNAMGSCLGWSEQKRAAEIQSTLDDWAHEFCVPWAG